LANQRGLELLAACVFHATWVTATRVGRTGSFANHKAFQATDEFGRVQFLRMK
jgi:hypothetical protein